MGFLFGVAQDDRLPLGRMVLLIAGSVTLTAHIFALNDWTGRILDRNDARREPTLRAQRKPVGSELAHVAIALLVVALVSFARLGGTALMFGAAIAAMSFLYSGWSSWGKGQPLVATLLHIAGAACHFLLGYSASLSMNTGSLQLAVFFGVVFAAGHLNQELRDYDADRYNGIRTTAVLYGRRTAWLASLLLFTASYIVLIVLALDGVVARWMVWIAVLWPWHFACALAARRSGFSAKSAVWLQKRYRLQFALLGIALALATPSGVALSRFTQQWTHQRLHSLVALAGR